MKKRKLESPSDVKCETTAQPCPSLSVNDEVKHVPFEKIVISIHPLPLKEEKLIDVLKKSIEFSNLQLRTSVVETDDSKMRCLLQIQDDDVISDLAKGKGSTGPEALHRASIKALKRLLKNCSTLKTCELSKESEINLEQILSWSSSECEKLLENNIGLKMMHSMGWTGGSLGKDGTGVSELNKGVAIEHCRGMGHEKFLEDWKFEICINNLLEDFVHRKPLKNLAFSERLCKRQKRIINQCFEFKWRQQLKRKILGYRKKKIILSPVFTPLELVEKVMSEGGKTGQYIAFPPGTLTLESFEALSENKLDLRPRSVEGKHFPFEKILIPPRAQLHEKDGWSDLLRESIEFSNLNIRVKYVQTDKTLCLIQIQDADGVSNLAEGEGCDDFDAHLAASKNAFEILLKNCYTLKAPEASINAKIKSSKLLAGKYKKDYKYYEDYKDYKDKDYDLSKNNIGARMLKTMGWTGGGLGKHGTGITEPIKEQMCINRSGIGHKSLNYVEHFRNATSHLLNGYVRSKPLTKLEFRGLCGYQLEIIQSCIRQNWHQQLKCEMVAGRFFVSPVFTPLELVEKLKSEKGKADHIAFPPGTLTLERFEDLFLKSLDTRASQSFINGGVSEPIPFTKIFVISHLGKRFYERCTNVLKYSLFFSNMKLKIELVITDRRSWTYLLRILDRHTLLYLAEGEGFSRKDAILSASINAMKVLLKNCYTVRERKISTDNLLDFETVRSWSDGKSELTTEGMLNADTETAEPMKKRPRRYASVQLCREREKTEDDIQFEDGLNNMLEDFVKQKRPLTNLVFSPQLSGAQKEIIRKCVALNWKSELSSRITFYDKWCQVISSRLTPKLVKRIIAEGGESDQYIVYPPDTVTFEDLASHGIDEEDFSDCTMVSHCDLGLGTEDKSTCPALLDAVPKLIDDFVNRQPQKHLAFPSDLSTCQAKYIQKYVQENRVTKGIYYETYEIDTKVKFIVFKEDKKEIEPE